MIFTHHRFSDALVENEILTGLVVFHVWTPFCKRFSMDCGLFLLAARGMERKHGGRRFEDCVSKGELAKTSWIASTNDVFSKRQHRARCLHSIGWKGKAIFPINEMGFHL